MMEGGYLLFYNGWLDGALSPVNHFFIMANY